MTRLRWAAVGSILWLAAWAISSCTSDEGGTTAVSRSVAAPTSPDLQSLSDRPLLEMSAGEAPPEAVCPDGADPDATGPMDQAQPDQRGPMAFDRASGQVVMVEVPEPRTWAFDVCTNTWHEMQPPEEPSARLRSLVYDADSGLTIGMDEFLAVWAYDLDANRWTAKDAVFPGSTNGSFRVVYDPVSGLVVGHGNNPVKIWAYDVEVDTWAEVPAQAYLAPLPLTAPDHHLFAYDSAADLFVLFDAGCAPVTCPEMSTWTFDRRMEVWEPSDASTPYLRTGYFASGGEAAFDEATGRTIAFSDGLVIGYKATTESWKRLYRARSAVPDDGPGRSVFLWIVYDSVNDRIVYVDSPPRRGVWAFDVADQRWITLVAPTCSVSNRGTGTAYGTLQEAVDAAGSGDTLLVSGACVGKTVILGTRLTLKGVPTSEQPTPRLDGAGVSRVLSVVDAKVVLRDLTIINGKAKWGAGIRLDWGGSRSLIRPRVTLNGHTSVTGNRAQSYGGAIWSFDDVVVVMNDSASITRNTAGVGGGVAGGTITLNDSASVSRNMARVKGGGIALYGGTLTLNDASSVTGNGAGTSGGGIYFASRLGGHIYICSDRVTISPNDPDDPPKVQHVCP